MLRRLVKVRAVEESARLSELEQAIAGVREVERGIDLQELKVVEAKRSGRRTLVAGESDEWRMSEQASTLATARARLLQEVLTVRESAEEAARKEYVASRMRGEQMRAVLERLKTEQALVHTRRSQAEMDDRYLARQRWLQMRGGREAEGLAT
jgi:hypothetical protein